MSSSTDVYFGMVHVESRDNGSLEESWSLRFKLGDARDLSLVSCCIWGFACAKLVGAAADA